MSLCKEKIGDSFNRNDGADKSCDIGMRNTVEVPSFHSLINLYFVSFLAPGEDTKDLVHLFFLKQSGNSISSAESSLRNLILILLNKCVGCGIYYSIISLCSGCEQHLVTGTKLTDLGKKTRPTISLLNNKTHSLFVLLENFVC